MRKLHCLGPALAAALTGPGAAWAAFEELGASARAMGMADSFSAVSGDLHGYHYNPAGLATLGGAQASVSYARLHTGLSDGSGLGLSQLAVGRPLQALGVGVAGAWHQLAFQRHYQERSLYLSAGRRLISGERVSISGGATLKQLTMSFLRPPEASNAMNLLTPTQQADPVLSGATTKSLLDVDAGLLASLGARWRAGLVAKHLGEPNLALGPLAAPLRRSIHLGAAWSSQRSLVTAETRLGAVAGSAVQELRVGGERLLGTHGPAGLGARAGIALGSRGLGQATAGLSFHLARLRLDYAFVLSLSGAPGPGGTHRLGLAFELGAHAPSKPSRPRSTRQPPSEPAPEESVATDVLALTGAGEYALAYSRVVRAAGPDGARRHFAARLFEVQELFPSLKSDEPWARAGRRAVSQFLARRDGQAVLLMSQALSLRRSDLRLQSLLLAFESQTGLPGQRLAHSQGGDLKALKLAAAARAVREGNHDESSRLTGELLVLSPDDPKALALHGSAHHLAGRHENALSFWNQALVLEKDPVHRRRLEEAIAQLRRKPGKKISRAVTASGIGD